MQGLKIAALYSFPAFKLGFCGPRGKLATRVFLNFLSGKKNLEKKIRKTLKDFKGVYPYYKLIAQSNGIPDPFNEKVVKAYWIGNSLFKKIKIADFRQMIIKDFSKPGLLSKEIALKKAKEIPVNSKPHHSFHVLIIGSVTGKIVLKGKSLDLCRISWGIVKKIKTEKEKSKIVVKYQPLVGEKILKLGKSIEKEIIWNKTLVPKLKISDWVSFHWNHLVERINKEDVKNLKKYTQMTLRALARIS